MGEYFRRRQFTIEETKTGADGVLISWLKKGSEKYLLQCKQWRTHKVGVKIVRELLVVMVEAEMIRCAVLDSSEAHQNQMLQLLSEPKKAAGFAQVVFNLLKAVG